jgi:hypothetical protein
MAAIRKNQLAAALKLVGTDGHPDLLLGHVDFKVLDRETGLIAGALRNEAGQRIGKVEIDGLPFEQLAAVRAPGRPRADEKHMAILLAWAWKCGELGGKMGEADEQIAAMFGYSAADKVRHIRNPLAKKLQIDLEKDRLWIIDDSSPGSGPPNCSVLVQNPAIYERPGGGSEIIGTGDLWAEGCGPRFIGGLEFRIEHDAAIPGEEVAKLMARKGPKIISIIRSGR